MFGLFKKKSFEEQINKTKVVKLGGMRFVIKRIDPIEHLRGINVLKKVYEVYQTRDKSVDVVENAEEMLKKIRASCKDLLLAGVVEPELVAKPEQGKICVDLILQDLSIAQGLAQSIIQYTYKKKLI